MAIKIKCKVNGLDNLEKKINTIVRKLPQTIEKSVEEILEELRICAIKLERGHNEKGILCELVDVANRQIKGRVYADPNQFMTDNNQSYLWFEYFGTRKICRTRTYRKNKTFHRIGLY